MCLCGHMVKERDLPTIGNMHFMSQVHPPITWKHFGPINVPLSLSMSLDVNGKHHNHMSLWLHVLEYRAFESIYVNLEWTVIKFFEGIIIVGCSICRIVLSILVMRYRTNLFNPPYKIWLNVSLVLINIERFMSFMVGNRIEGRY